MRNCLLILGALCALVTSAYGQMPGTFTPMLSAGAATAPPSLSYRTHAETQAGGISATFTSQDIGTAASNRFVIVAVLAGSTGGSANTIASVTVGGTALTLAKSQFDSGNFHAAAIFIGNIPSGTTATIVASLTSGSSSRWGIGVWAAYALNSITPTATNGGTSSGTLTLDTNVQAGGIVTGVIFSNSGGTTTWTGLTKRYDSNAINGESSGADFTAIAAQTPLAITAVAPANGVGCTAAFR